MKTRKTPRQSCRLWLLVLVLGACQLLSAQEYFEFEEEADESSADSLDVDSCAADPSLAWPGNVQSRLDQLLRSDLFRTSHVGLMVYDLTADSVLYRYNERQRMRPASTMKMLNAVAALDCLGGSYLLRTQLRYTGVVDSITLRGNLYVRGGMDPLFDGDDLRAFVESLRSLHIDTIRGNLCADLSMKDRKRLGEGWCWDDDNPVLTPLLIDGHDTFLKRFARQLRAAGIVLLGDTLRAATPALARDLCARTHTIDQLLQRMMKRSNNLFAESLFYQMAARSGLKGPATAAGARLVMNRLIEKMGLRPADYYLADGSGLSLYDYVSPELEVRFLRYAYDNSNIFGHLLPSLPVAGVDGTLARRMRSGRARANVKAKTGTVEGVSALAGYCTAANGHYLCFSIINMGIAKAAAGRAFQDRVCEALCAE